MEKAHLPRCAATLVIATYEKSTPHSSGFARLVSEAFCKAVLKIEEGIIKEIMELHQLTIHELQEKIKSGDVSATQITQSVFSRIDAVEERVHSYIRLLKEEALAAAAKADESKKGRHKTVNRYSHRVKRYCLHQRHHHNMRFAHPA